MRNETVEGTLAISPTALVLIGRWKECGDEFELAGFCANGRSTKGVG